MRLKLIAFTIMVLVCRGSLSAGQVKADLLQVKLNRLYFSVGTEAMIYPDASFALICRTDTIAHGRIEFSAPGIAISRPDTLFARVETMTDCHSIIETAEIDTTSPIRIGFIGETESVCDRLIRTDDSTRTIEYILFANKIDLAVAFDSGGVDLTIALDDIPVTRSAAKLESTAPLIAVMIPNPESRINNHALLTTSLYYRYSSPSSSLFDGITPTVEYCLYPRDDLCRRAYPYDAESGRKLAERLRMQSDKVTIAYSDPSLEQSALFFADILARDRFRTVLTETESNADIYLSYFDFDPESATTGLAEIVLFLTLLNETESETIVSAGNNISEAERSDLTAFRHYCDLASSRLTQELGVFPLFRINYQLIKQNNIGNVKFAPSGALLVDSLVRVILPSMESVE